MIELEQLRYVRLGTRDLQEASEFATGVLGLQHVRTESSRAYFRSDYRDHTLCYVLTESHYASFAFDVRTPEVLERARQAVADFGLKPRFGTEDECADRRVKAFIVFEDRTGNSIEIVLRPLMSGWRYFPGRDAGVTGLQSIALRSMSVDDERLWTTVFNGRISDWVGDACYIRIDRLHHRLSLHPSSRAGVLAVGFEIEGIDQLMQANYFLKNRQIRIKHGPGREPTSGQMFITFEGPDGVLFRFATGMTTIADDRAHLPRQFPDAPSSYCAWGSEVAIKELAGARPLADIEMRIP